MIAYLYYFIFLLFHISIIFYFYYFIVLLFSIYVIIFSRSKCIINRDGRARMLRLKK